MVFALNFGAYRVFGDGTTYYSFVQRLFGDTSRGSGYNFGVGLMNAPFYGTAKIVQSVYHGSGRIAHDLPAASITIASITFGVIALLLSASIVSRLGLPHPNASALAAIFGSPLWYYASFSPSYSHAADAAAFSLAAFALWRTLETRGLRWPILTGAALALMVAVRPFNAAMILALIAVLLVARRGAEALPIALASVATYGLLVLLPVLLGTGLTMRPDGTHVATRIAFVPLNPVRILFSLHRGLFLWTPLTAVAALGLILFLRRRGPGRLYVAALTAMVIGLLCSYASYEVWDGGWSFSARYLSGPTPLYAIGVSAVLGVAAGWLRRVAVVAVTVAVAFSLFLGMNHAFGATQSDGANNIVDYYVAGKRSLGDFAHLTWSYSRVRHIADRLP